MTKKEKICDIKKQVRVIMLKKAEIFIFSNVIVIEVRSWWAHLTHRVSVDITAE